MRIPFTKINVKLSNMIVGLLTVFSGVVRAKITDESVSESGSNLEIPDVIIDPNAPPYSEPPSGPSIIVGQYEPSNLEIPDVIIDPNVPPYSEPHSGPSIVVGQYEPSNLEIPDVIIDPNVPACSEPPCGQGFILRDDKYEPLPLLKTEEVKSNSNSEENTQQKGKIRIS